VVEAATKTSTLKLQIFQTIEVTFVAQCDLATNTSSISITQIAAQVVHQTRY
jgi:3-hydroxybutyryl-CoA dehydrogenase